MADIGEDIDKVIGFINEIEGISHGIVLATIWDPDDTKIPKLEKEYAEQLETSKLIFLPIEISQFIDPYGHSDWEGKHANLHERYRCQ